MAPVAVKIIFSPLQIVPLIDDTILMVGVGAIKYFDLMHSVQSDVVFDWEKIMNMEGNSGPYLQYTFARTQSVLAKARSTKHEARNVSDFVFT